MNKSFERPENLENTDSVLLGTLRFGCNRYSVGETHFRQICKDAGAVHKLGRSWRFDVRRVDEFLLGQQQDQQQ